MRRRGPRFSVISLVLVGVLSSACSTAPGARENDSRPTESTTDRDRSSTTTLGDATSTSAGRVTTTSETGVGEGEGPVGVLGCSNTAQHVDGYLAASAVDRLVPTPLGGGDLDTWADPASNGYESHWQEFISHVAVGSVGSIWVQICPRGSGPVMTAGEQAALTSIIDRLREEYGDLPIQVSGINLYEEGYLCRKMGESGVEVSWALADWGVANLELIRGPETGPLGEGTVDQDGCHLSPAGEALVGGQLVEWFD